MPTPRSLDISAPCWIPAKPSPPTSSGFASGTKPTGSALSPWFEETTVASWGRSGFFVRDWRTWSTTTLRAAGDYADVEVGWTLARDCWGAGYATEAAEACRDHGFARLGLQRIIALILEGNERSVAVARRLGMRHERDVHGSNGVDSHIFVLTRAEWQESLGL